MFQRTQHSRLDELKRLDSLYAIAIGQQEKQIDNAKRGKLRFTQITNKTLFGLLVGDLTRLKENKEQNLLDILQLEEEIKKAETKTSDELEQQPEPAASPSEPIQAEPHLGGDEIEVSSPPMDAEEDKQEKEHIELTQEVEKEAILEVKDSPTHSIEGEDNDPSSKNEPICFDTIETPDITNDNLLDTLRALDGIDDDERFTPLFS